MDTIAVVLREPGQLVLDRLTLATAAPDELTVAIEWSGISTGTERLLYTGGMPPFPGMGYPLVPGYESVGTVLHAGAAARIAPGTRVFVPGARCFGDVRGLFGGAAARVVVPESRVITLGDTLREQGVLLALAATAHHALMAPDGTPSLPGLITGHGVLGRLLARIAVALGGAPTVWEPAPQRQGGAQGYCVTRPEADPRRDHACIVDASGDAGLLDTLIARLGRGGELVLAGFYPAQLGFTFFPAFMREARLRIAAEWQPADLAAVRGLIDLGRLSLDGLITHRAPAADAARAYETAFGDPACLKMILDWSGCA